MLSVEGSKSCKKNAGLRFQKLDRDVPRFARYVSCRACVGQPLQYITHGSRMYMSTLLYGTYIHIINVLLYLRELSRGDSAILISPVTDDMHFRAAVLRTETSSMPRNRCNVLLIAKVMYTIRQQTPSCTLHVYQYICDVTE